MNYTFDVNSTLSVKMQQRQTDRQTDRQTEIRGECGGSDLQVDVLCRVDCVGDGERDAFSRYVCAVDVHDGRHDDRAAYRSKAPMNDRRHRFHANLHSPVVNNSMSYFQPYSRSAGICRTMSHYHFLSLNFGFFDYLFLYLISCTFYKLLTIILMKAASSDGPFGSACPMLILKCRIVMLITLCQPCTKHPADDVTLSNSPPTYSLLSPSITHSLFHSRLKTHLFHKSFPP